MKKQSADRTGKQQGLARELVGIIFLAGVASVVLLAVSQVVLNRGLRFWFEHSDVQQNIARKQVEELQVYITEEDISDSEVEKLDDWAREHRSTLLEIYEDHALIYASYDRHTYVGPRDDMPDEKKYHPRDYSWMPVYTLAFSDGTADAVLYFNGMDAYYGAGCEILLALCIFWWFPMFFLLGSRKYVKYIVQLSEEIQAMEGGDLDHPITVRGADEITTLARCLDSMRLTLRSQQEQEAEASARVKSLITEMSHDLRTPLTTLLLYTEIVRYHKYDAEEQRNDYLVKIDEKARQIKQLSDNLFEYALVTRDTVVTLDPPARFSQIFEGPLTEVADQLQQKGFACALELGEEDVTLTVKAQYVHRVLDNIISNCFKYADPGQEIAIRYLREGEMAGLSFFNRTLPAPAAAESTKVGLTSMKTMMEKMHGVCRIESGPDWFCVTLLFPVTE